MKKVITYGTYDMLHYGHIRLLERAKELGDYLVVGVTSDDFDRRRGKLNVSQSLAQRIKNVRDTGLADEIIIEEYEGQKIDDINNLGIDVFCIGSDWEGKFDYLKEYCEVVYLERTKGISSTELRSQKSKISLGCVGRTNEIGKLSDDAKYVNGIDEISIYDTTTKEGSFEDVIEKSNAVYINSSYLERYDHIKFALQNKKHVLVETPILLDTKKLSELYDIAGENDCVLMDANKTAYLTAYSRLLLLLKTGVIGDIISIDATCTSLNPRFAYGSMADWGGVGLLPVFQILGTDYKNKLIKSFETVENKDAYDKIDLVYDNATATVQVGNGVKSEGHLIVSGTDGYVYVPAPWWKTEYFEIRYEDQNKNKRYFYALDGNGYRNELVTFVKAVNDKRKLCKVSNEVTFATTKIMEDFNNEIDIIKIKKK